MSRINPFECPNIIRNKAADVAVEARKILIEYDHRAFYGAPFEMPLEVRIPEFMRSVGQFLFWADALNEEAQMGIDAAKELRAGYEAERARFGKEEE